MLVVSFVEPRAPTKPDNEADSKSYQQRCLTKWVALCPKSGNPESRQTGREEKLISLEFDPLVIINRQRNDDGR